MCMFRSSGPGPAATALTPSADNREAMRLGRLEAALRRRRSGAAANVLTSPVGLPSGQGVTRTMGGVA